MPTAHFTPHAFISLLKHTESRTRKPHSHDSLLIYWPRLKNRQDSKNSRKAWKTLSHIFTFWQVTRHAYSALSHLTRSLAETHWITDTQTWPAALSTLNTLTFSSHPFSDQDKKTTRIEKFSKKSFYNFSQAVMLIVNNRIIRIHSYISASEDTSLANAAKIHRSLHSARVTRCLLVHDALK